MNDEEESGNVAPSTLAVQVESAGAQPEWVLVPREPTKEMLDAVSYYPAAWTEAGLLNNYRAMLSAAPPAPSAWLPISSAPKDGTEVLLSHSMIEGVSIGTWNINYWSANHEAYEDADFNAWMPLPPPPEKTA